MASGSEDPLAGSSGNRPRSLTAIGWLFIAVGCVGIIVRVWEFASAITSGRGVIGGELSDLLFAEASSLIAAFSGMMVLLGARWVRWVLLAWMGFHMVLAALHSLAQLTMHAAIFALTIFFLFSPRETAYFNTSGSRGARP